jgi:histidine triad (HIT) family protein
MLCKRSVSVILAQTPFLERVKKENFIIKCMAQKSVLFVCTGNTFRSMIAECLFKKYLADNKISGWKVGSAGIIAKKNYIDPKTIESLKRLGIKRIGHRQRKLTKNMLGMYDVIVVMDETHRDFIRSELNYRNVLLFNELAINKHSSIWDIDEVKDFETDRKAVEKKIERTVKYIYREIPALFKNISERYYLFSDLVNGVISHRNGFPFIALYETKNTVAFMSIDIPSKEDGNILVIPKERYVDLAEIPTDVLNELAYSVQKIGKAISINHGGYNILLNNGTSAGQYIFHTHFHIIPRNYNDGIKIEEWNNKNISVSKFIKLNNRLLEQISRAR